VGIEPDGFNINRDVGSTSPLALRKKVRELRADVGVALDGDADRVIIVDELGDPIDGDQLMPVVAESWREQGQLAKPGVVAIVMSNLGPERHLASLGLKLERTAVGDRYVIERMRQEGYNVGGEQSGHLILSDFSTTGDGLVTALQILAMVKNRGRPISDVCRRFEPLPQILRNVRAQKRQLEETAVVTAIDVARRRLGAGGRLIVRPSGTEPVIRIMGEGDDPELVEKLVAEICGALKEVAQAA
jgi:phosphoglucosamine mutase